MEKADKYGVWIPPEVYHNPDLSDGEKLLTGRIIALANGEGCTAGNSFFAEDMGKSQKHISDMISRLIKAGILEVEFIPKEFKRVLKPSGKIRIPLRKNPDTPPEKSGGVSGKIRMTPPEKSGYPSGKIRNIDKEYRISNENKSESVPPPTPTPPPEPKPVKPQHVMPPTFEMFAAHWIEKGYPGGRAGAQICFDHYDMKGWKSGTTKLSNWHAVARNASTWDRIVNLKKPNSGWNLRKEL